MRLCQVKVKTEIDSSLRETLLYHEQTKHHFHRYAVQIVSVEWKP